MTATDRLERDLADWFRETAAPALPHYTDDIVRQATRVRRPHRWTLLERWLPMTETALQPVRLSPVPWRPIALLALLALAMVAGVALMAGNRPSVPAPFGLANNGLVAYGEASDIYTVDPVTGTSRAIATGMDRDEFPRWSPDGTRVAFLRAVGAIAGRVVIVNADGGNPVTSIDILNEPDSDTIAWAPDGRSVAVAADHSVGRGIYLIDAVDGTSTIVDSGYDGLEFFWRPPDGRQILFAGRGAAGPGLLLYALDTGAVEELQAVLAPGQEAVRPIGWTADGTHYAYQLETGGPMELATRVVDVGTGQFVDVPVAYGHISNDGTRIAGLDGRDEGLPCVAPTAGGECRTIGTVDQAPDGGTRASLHWSPDDRWLVTDPMRGWVRPQLLDPDGTVVDQPDWLADGAESWQRVP